MRCANWVITKRRRSLPESVAKPNRAAASTTDSARASSSRSRDVRGRVLGFGGRALEEGEDAAGPQAKYINSPQGELFDKSRLLYGLDRARPAIRESGVAVVVEGYLDAIQAHQLGYRNVVAQMGTALTEPQLRLLLPAARSQEERRIVLALDADPAGQAATRRSLETARRALTQDLWRPPRRGPAHLAIGRRQRPRRLLREEPERWPALVEGAIPLPQYVIDQELAALPTDATIPQRERPRAVSSPCCWRQRAT